MRKKLIINADDFGYSRGINFGIIDAHHNGVLTSTTLMTNMPGASHAYQLANETPTLGVGIHLTLTAGSPILKHLQTITDENGHFRNLKYYLGFFDVDLVEVYEEWKAQIKQAIANGIQPTHLDSHHHIHSYGELTEVVIDLAKEFDLPVRRVFEPETNELSTIRTTEAFEYKIDTIKDPIKLAEKFSDAQSIEVMTHPAYLDKAIINGSSFNYPRVDELALLTDKALKETYKNHNMFELTHYRSI
ncbi:chitin disaccharide deacetylase [Halobacillus shinanisalinarum]|uniref:Chitin disaccharide deacetylase n=1 Tax=Halobacillus shinanisalinarum TaxID=2932258 RepID=A0ABY4H344_9BACI|nr:chitin disaccharide deacetylase [Halobacillus shinanisalinarum]UOQ94545.1 chitin disaccharide deacetylase [Halobacillus shinanisalinarum]